jgi:L-malate glycosyltransferase
MKILHCIAQLGIGGAEKQLYELIVNTHDPSVSHEVMYYNDSLDTEAKRLYDQAGIRTIRVPRNSKHPLRFLRDFSALIKASHPDIVHCWLGGANVWGRLAALRAGHQRIIVAYRGGKVFYVPLMRVLECLTGRKVHHLANSRACAAMTARSFGLLPEKFDVIYNGVDLKRFEGDSIRVKLCSQYKIPENAPIVTMVGRLTASKNYPMLLQIAKRTKDHAMGVHFLIAGHGEEEQTLKDLAVQLGVGDIVHFLGLRHDVPVLLKSSNVFCYTTLFEGFPNALLEAMAAGLPIITTDFDGVDELVTDGINGKIVPIGRVDLALDALKHYIHDKETSLLHGRNSRQLTEAKFSVSSMVNTTMDYYRKLIGE